MEDYQLDGNKEMVALGSMNIIGSFTSFYVATGSLSNILFMELLYRRKFV
ncbi:putative SLC26A/SulP transporter [Helianthus anomalus]